MNTEFLDKIKEDALMQLSELGLKSHQHSDDIVEFLRKSLLQTTNYCISLIDCVKDLQEKIEKIKKPEIQKKDTYWDDMALKLNRFALEKGKSLNDLSFDDIQENSFLKENLQSETAFSVALTTAKFVKR